MLSCVNKCVQGSAHGENTPSYSHVGFQLFSVYVSLNFLCHFCGFPSLCCPLSMSLFLIGLRFGLSAGLLVGVSSCISGCASA